MGLYQKHVIVFLLLGKKGCFSCRIFNRMLHMLTPRLSKCSLRTLNSSLSTPISLKPLSRRSFHFEISFSPKIFFHFFQKEFFCCECVYIRSWCVCVFLLIKVHVRSISAALSLTHMHWERGREHLLLTARPCNPKPNLIIILTHVRSKRP